MGNMSSVGDSSNLFIAAMKTAKADRVLQQEISQDSFADTLQDVLKETVNPFAARMRTTTKSLKTRRDKVNSKSPTEQTEKTQKTEKTESQFQKVRDKAQQFEEKNPELKGKTLELLRSFVKPGDSKEEILKKVQEFFKDPYLADEALDFLKETCDGDLKDAVKEAKENFEKNFSREIKSGKNMSTEARLFAEKGLGSADGLRDMYRDITGNPREPKNLFNELTQKFPYKKMNTVIKFLLHSIGSDLRSQGPSIPRGLLHNLFKQIRSLQMILGVYRFFSSRTNLISMEFKRFGLDIPRELNFETLSKNFMQLASDRYPAADRILKMLKNFGIHKTLNGKIIVLSQFRDAINQVAGEQIFRSVQHRIEVFQAIIEALEQLEDELELLEDGDEDESMKEGKEEPEEEEKENLESEQ